MKPIDANTQESHDQDQELFDDEDEGDAEPAIPEPGDWVTYDHVALYDTDTGRLIAAMPDPEGDFTTWLRQVMESQNFYPNVWWVSDHGNPHLIRP
jgi:hypothetical protein